MCKPIHVDDSCEVVFVSSEIIGGFFKVSININKAFRVGFAWWSTAKFQIIRVRWKCSVVIHSLFL